MALASSCVSHKKLVLFQDVEQAKEDKSDVDSIYLIQPGDLLHINVASLDQESSNLFNRQSSPTHSESYNTASLYIKSLSVDETGNIEIPIVGKVNVGGKSMEEVYSMVTEILDNYYKHYSLDIKLVNFRVTLLGEVSVPSTYNFFQKRVTLLEAVARAKGFTDYADLKEVVLIRHEKGVKKTHILDFSSINVVNSNNYQLNSGDVIYVKPLKAKSWRVNTNVVQLVTAGLSTIVLPIYYLLIP